MVQALLREIKQEGTGKTQKKLYVRKNENPNSHEHLTNRLINGITINETTECWEWQKHKNNHGYGKLTVSGRGAYAHRLAYKLWVQPIPEGMNVLHTCDNPSCINPNHLSVGTQSDNMKDCYQKGRAKITPQSFKGTENPAAILNDAQVLSIKRLLSKGWTQKEIALRHGISQAQVSNIKRGLQWK